LNRIISLRGPLQLEVGQDGLNFGLREPVDNRANRIN